MHPSPTLRPVSPFKRLAQRVVSTSRALPEGSYAILVGVVAAGVVAYVFQILSFRSLSEPDYAALNALWVFVFVLAPGFFLPLEQEISRAVASRRASGLGGGPVIRRAALFGAWLTCGLVVATIVVALTTNIVERLFAGSAGLVVCLVLALFAYSFQSLTRGTLSGNARFGPYGMVLAAEAFIRLVPCIVLAAAGVSDPVWYGLCIAIPPALASVVSVRRQRGLLAAGPPAPWAELSANLGLLLAGSVLAQTLSYAPFIGVQLLASPHQKDAVVAFVVGLFLARIPIILFQGVQAALLPNLADLAGSGQRSGFRAAVRRLVLVVVAITLVGTVAALVLGPTVGQILFGDGFTLDGIDLALLAAGSGVFILALTLSQGLIALMGHAGALVAWSIGIVVFVGVTALAGPALFRRVELGFIAAVCASAALMGVFLVSRARTVPDDGLAALVEQIEHEPLEI